MKLRQIKYEDINKVCHLINQAYRGEVGWTKETEIVSGERIDKESVKTAMKDKHTYFLVWEEENTILGTVSLEVKDNYVYLGLLTIDPRFQEKGRGKQLLDAAEVYATSKLGVNAVRIAVIEQRRELVAYYERRGYRKRDETMAYPKELRVGEPLRDDLCVIFLEKII